MKAISIWQPHASLLMSGLHKPYETRSWKPWANLIGQRIWIHAGKATDDLEDMMEYLYARAEGGALDPAWEAYCAALKQMGCQSARNFDHVSALNFDQATETISGA